MLKNNVFGTFSIGFNYTTTVNEMIADGELTTDEEIREYIKTCILEDIASFVENDKNVLRNVNITIDE